MKIVTDKQMKEILARLDSMDSKLDNVDLRVDKLDSNLNEFKHTTEVSLTEINFNLNEFKYKTEVKLAEINSMGSLCKTQFKCMSLIVSSLMAVILLGSGTYLVNINDRLTNDYKTLQEKVETIK